MYIEIVIILKDFVIIIFTGVTEKNLLFFGIPEKTPFYFASRCLNPNICIL